MKSFQIWQLIFQYYYFFAEENYFIWHNDFILLSFRIHIYVFIVYTLHFDIQ